MAQAQVQWLARSGKIPCKNSKAVGNTRMVVPKCATYEFTKAHKRPTEAVYTHAREDKEMELKKGDLFPGQQVSVDHYQSAVPGRLCSSRGSHNPDKMYCGGSAFVDHDSDNVAVRHQISLSASDSIKAKLKYEMKAQDSKLVV